MSPFRTFLTLLIVAAPLGAEEIRKEARSLAIVTGETVSYLFYRPNDADQETPLLLFLHGGGESGDDIELLRKHGPPAEIEKGRDFPFYIVSPQNPDENGFWDEDRLARFLDALGDEMDYDRDRLYLAGMSRGAYGAYRLAMENPARFAALLAICGAAPSPYAGWLGDLPVWIVHGTDDPVIPVAESERMTATLRERGNEAKLTIHEGAGHDTWTRTFEGEEWVKWFLSQARTRN